MRAAKTEITEAAVLAAMQEGCGTATYLIRNRIDHRHATQPSVAEVRKLLNRMEAVGKVHRTKGTLPNSVVWAKGPARRPGARP